MESYLGITLFERTSRSMALTHAESLLFQRCLEVYWASRRAQDTVESLRKGSDGRVATRARDDRGYRLGEVPPLLSV